MIERYLFWVLGHNPDPNPLSNIVTVMFAFIAPITFIGIIVSLL